jgi:AMP deaminase
LTFRAELNTAGAAPVLSSKKSLEGPSGLTINTSFATAPAAQIRSRSKSVPRDDLTSPRIASLGLGLSTTNPVSANGSLAWVDGKEVPHGSPILDESLENADAIDEGFTAGPFVVFARRATV